MRISIIFLFTIFLISACGNTVNRDSSSQADTAFEGEAKVMLYYFHGKQRCPACLAIQKVTEDAYVNYLIDNKDVGYKEVDISLKHNEALAEKYEIVWSSLIIASEKEHKDLTDYGFGMAMNNPEVLIELIVDETNRLLNDGQL